MYLVTLEVVVASDADMQILKLEQGVAGFERAVVYDMRTKERCWLNDASVLSKNHSENEALALGLRDADTHDPLNWLQWIPFFDMVKHKRDESPSISSRRRFTGKESRGQLEIGINTVAERASQRPPPRMSGYSGQRSHHLRGQTKDGA